MGKKKSSLLWYLEKEGQKNAYLFGTMHVKDRRVFLHTPFIKLCVLQQECYAAEFDLNDSDPVLYNVHTTLPEGTSLAGLLRPKVFKKLEQLFEQQTGHSIHAFLNKTPFFITSLLTDSVFKAHESKSLDVYLFEFAEKSGKITTGVETFKDQIEVLKHIPLTYQLRSLKKMIRSFRSVKKEHEQLAVLYTKQDIQKLYKKSKRGMGKLRNLMIHQRNERMAERIDELATQHALFASVGAGHLSGKHGLLRLLKKKGYRLTPVLLEVRSDADNFEAE